MELWKDLDNSYIMNTATRLPVVVEKATGNYIYDVNGKKYLDLFSGLGVNILGHRHPQLLEKIQEQTQNYLHVSNYFYAPSAITLAKRLVDYTLTEGKVFYTSSGAEVTEAMLKLIHLWSKEQEEKKEGIVVLKNSFHGRTLGALHLTRQPKVYQDFPEFTFPIYEVTPNNINELRDICCKSHTPAAILFEPILGSGGVITLDEEYIKEIQAICTKENILMCVDEIQTGVGRTGELFAYKSFDIQPDLLLFAKAIGGGLPLGGLIAGKKAADVFKPGDHGTTFSPSPLSTAVAHGVLDILTSGLLEQSQRVIAHLWQKLGEINEIFPSIHTIDGKGMMVGIHTTYSFNTLKQFQLELLKDGILVDITAGNVIRLLPPLTLTRNEVDFFCDVFTKRFAQI